MASEPATKAPEAPATVIRGARRDTPPAGASVEVAGLVRRFGDREALAGVTTAVGEGQTLAVLGPNGAGKTTLLRVLATLLTPHGGSVRVLGHELPRDAHAVRASIGLVGHEPLLYRELSGRENLAFYARLYAVPDADQRISEVLETTAMERRADDPVRALSRGMVQRLAIARAVLHRPALLLLDEPRAGLDPAAADIVEALIGRATGHTRVLVAHDAEAALAEADLVLGLRDGRAVFEAPARDIELEQVRALYGRRLR
jgi:heme exporter protein A